jgi:hypothetical protein
VLESLKKREANSREKFNGRVNKLAADENLDIAELLFGDVKPTSD